jgi:hypothetical protein
VKSGALRARADATEALARLAWALADEPSADPAALLPIGEAARAAGTSVRVVRDAIPFREPLGVWAAAGPRRARADVDRWIESRHVRPLTRLLTSK